MVFVKTVGKHGGIAFTRCKENLYGVEMFCDPLRQ